MRWLSRKLCSSRGMVYFLIVVHFLCAASLLMPALLMADEPVSSSSETPAATADYTLLLKRLEALEARIRALEQKDDGSVGQEIGEATETTVGPQKPILNVRTEEWCAPCRRFKADLAALKADYEKRGIEFPIEVVINPAGVRWSSNQIPQFSFNAAGRTVNQVGYTAGQLPRMIERMTE